MSTQTDPATVPDAIRVVSIDSTPDAHDVDALVAWIEAHPDESMVAWGLGAGAMEPLSGDTHAGRAVVTVRAEDFRTPMAVEAARYADVAPLRAYAAVRLTDALRVWDGKWRGDDKPGAPKEAKPRGPRRRVRDTLPDLEDLPGLGLVLGAFYCAAYAGARRGA